MKYTKFLMFIIGFLSSLGAVAQESEPLTIGRIMDLEGQVAVKKLTDQLTTSSNVAGQTAPISGVNVPPIAVVSSTPARPIIFDAPKPATQKNPETLNIYGISPDYRADLIIQGTSYSVGVGSVVGPYTVKQINAQGTMLEEIVVQKKINSRKKANITGETTTKIVFAPLAHN